MIKYQEPEEPVWAKYITEDNLPTEDLQYLCSIIGLEATKKLMLKAAEKSSQSMLIAINHTKDNIL